MHADDQKKWLLENGYDEKTLKDNQWRPKSWTEEDDAIFDRMNDDAVRNFLPCPQKTCHSIGCYKPRYNPDYNEFSRYYVCKWCGYGRTKAGEWQWYPDPKSGWGYKNERSRPTPKELCDGLDPWCG